MSKKDGVNQAVVDKRVDRDTISKLKKGEEEELNPFIVVDQNDFNKRYDKIMQKQLQDDYIDAYTKAFQDYMSNKLNLDCKEEFVVMLERNKLYQRCFLFFNDNRKYRQLYELYRAMVSSVIAGYDKEYFSSLTDNAKYPTSIEFCQFVRKQQPEIISLDGMYNIFFERAKKIANRIVSSCCLGCTAEPQVKE